MPSVTEQAIEAGARALFDEERNESMGDVPWPEYDSDDNLGRPIWEEHSQSVLRAQWPILSAGLRELHGPTMPDPETLPSFRACAHCIGEGEEYVSWPCPTMAAIQKIDEELGCD